MGGAFDDPFDNPLQYLHLPLSILIQWIPFCYYTYSFHRYRRLQILKVRGGFFHAATLLSASAINILSVSLFAFPEIARNCEYVFVSLFFYVVGILLGSYRYWMIFIQCCAVKEVLALSQGDIALSDFSNSQDMFWCKRRRLW